MEISSGQKHGRQKIKGAHAGEKHDYQTERKRERESFKWRTLDEI